MSLTHFSSNLPETLWWTQTQNHHNPYPIMDSHYHHNQPPSSTYNFTKQESDQDSTSTTTDHMSKEPMFEKPLTPSDVGKLNRLVIPKQHAEKYFPLGGCSDRGVCSSTTDPSLTPAEQQQKGLLLCFEDESGKPWRFRYSYWNSSQSYVLTKGWSRYVKEKRLDAGDVVLFEKHRFDGDRFFIGWRRRQVVQDSLAAVAPPVGVGGAQVSNGWTTTRGFYDAHVNSYPSHHLPPSLHHHHHPYQPDCLHAGGINDNQRGDMVATSGNPRRVRLFGVNLECPDDSEPSTPDGSSQGSGLGLPHYQYFSNSNNMVRRHQFQPDEVPPTSRIRSEECDMCWISQFCQQNTPLDAFWLPNNLEE